MKYTLSSISTNELEAACSSQVLEQSLPMCACVCVRETERTLHYICTCTVMYTIYHAIMTITCIHFVVVLSSLQSVRMVYYL